jgi:hypothetical protein
LSALKTVAATDLLSREYSPPSCLKADPSDCYFPRETAPGSAVQGQQQQQAATSSSGSHNVPGRALTATMARAISQNVGWEEVVAALSFRMAVFLLPFIASSPLDGYCWSGSSLLGLMT